MKQIVCLMVFVPVALMAQVARPEKEVPLKNWATPLYWQPNQTERQTAGTIHPEFQLSPTAVSTNALTFVAVTPCRLVDTRGVSAGFNGIAPFSGPAISAMGTLTIPVQSATEASTNTTPAPCGVIPSIAQAYSFNLTVVPQGAFGFLSIWPSGATKPVVSTLNDLTGQIESNAVIVPAGTPSGGVSVYNSGGATTDVIIDMNGFFAAPTDLNGNTGVGLGTLANNSGTNNTAVGNEALTSNTSGYNNTATGNYALGSNTTGCCNAADGNAALSSNTTGSSNTAMGGLAMQANTTGNNNTGLGHAALNVNTTGNNNTATGANVLQNNTTGNNNTASGQNAMSANSTGCCNTASGQNAMGANTTGSFNVGLGGSALQDNTTGSNNTTVGQGSMANNTIGCCNAALGQAALNANTTGNSNVAVGGSALQNNTSAGSNTAVGQAALFANTTGNNNTATGQAALNANTTGVNNTAVGQGALAISTTGNGNTSVGNGSLRSNIIGYQNTAVGISALANSTGNTNIAIGEGAGSSLTTGSSNIDIGNAGVSGETNIIRIGAQGTQTNTYIAGIYGATPNVSNLMVCIDANGNLGTSGCSGTASSARFKEQIADMGERSSGLLQLRPVTFFYKPQYDDGSHALQYGLIAEEVAKLYPDMVGYDKEGQPASVKYQSLAPMLLNEVQKQDVQLKNQAKTVELVQEQNRKLEERLAALEALLSGKGGTTAGQTGSQ